MGLKEKLSAVFILLRPYSLPGLFLLYYVAKVIITNSLTLNTKSILAFIPIFFAWVYFVLLLEAEHKHSNREKIPYTYPTTALVITAILAVAFGGFTPIIPLMIFLVFVHLYIKKNTILIIGNTSFIIRGFVETSLFFLSLSILSTAYLQTSTILFGLVILLISSARNLLGDIRDTKFDELTFSVRFGDKLSYITTILLYVIGGYILFIITQGSLGVIFPIILMVISLALIDNGHTLHRLAVTLSSIIMAAYLLFISGNSELLILLNILFLSILSSLIFYNLVPRKSNPQDNTTIFGIAPWSKRAYNNKKIVQSHKHPNLHLSKRTKPKHRGWPQ